MNHWVTSHFDKLERERKAEDRARRVHKNMRRGLFNKPGRGEHELLLELTSNGEYVIPQHPVLSYFCDLYLPNRGLIIEVTSIGSGHRDWRRLMARKDVIEAQGYRVVYVSSRAHPSDIWQTMAQL